MAEILAIFATGQLRVATNRLSSLVPNAAVPPSSEADNSEVKILVVEDNSDDQAMLLHQLHKSGINDRVMCVGDGDDALKLLRNGAEKLSAVAAVFLDLSLPGVDGLMLLKVIRSNVETALLPVFVLTGSTNPKDEAEARRLGATSFIPKALLSLPSFRANLAQLFRPVSVGGEKP